MVLVGEQHVCVRCLVHEQGFAQRARALAEHLVGTIWDNGAKGEDEVVDVLHVEVVRGDGIGHRVRCQLLRPLACEGGHVLWVKLHWVVLQLVPRDGFEAPRSARKIRVTLHPREAVQVDHPLSSVVLLVGHFLDATLQGPVHVVSLGPIHHEGIVEKVSVEGYHHMRTGLAHQRKEPTEQARLVFFIVGLEDALVLWLGRVLQRLNVGCNLCPVDDEKSRPINHDRNHRDPIARRIRKFQRLLRGLNIPGKDSQSRLLLHVQLHDFALCVVQVLDAGGHLVAADIVPLSHVDLVVNADSVHIRDVVLVQLLQVVSRRPGPLVGAVEADVVRHSLCLHVLQEIHSRPVHALRVLKGELDKWSFSANDVVL
mmetsp:Transcript_50911/g.118620  ORF Transcript_50911/g.118620 Transcript_50911/m.118620 type:complete len:370 (-) Transcript_50911:242-1351(-)